MIRWGTMHPMSFSGQRLDTWQYDFFAFLLARGVGSPSRKVTHIRTPQRPQADMYEESGHYGVGPPTVMPPASACPSVAGLHRLYPPMSHPFISPFTLQEWKPHAAMACHRKKEALDPEMRNRPVPCKLHRERAGFIAVRIV